MKCKTRTIHTLGYVVRNGIRVPCVRVSLLSKPRYIELSLNPDMTAILETDLELVEPDADKS